MTRPRSPARFGHAIYLPAVHLSAALLTVAALQGCDGCPEADEPSHAPSSLAMGAQEPDRLLSLESIDRSLPGFARAHTAWLIEWEGARPARLDLERSIRGECFARASYAYTGDGELQMRSFESRGASEGEDAEARDSILSNLLRDSVEAPERWLRRQDAVGRLVYAYREASPRVEGAPPVEVMGSISYEPESCVLPPVIMARDVPSKLRPARHPSEENRGR